MLVTCCTAGGRDLAQYLASRMAARTGHANRSGSSLRLKLGGRNESPKTLVTKVANTVTGIM